MKLKNGVAKKLSVWTKLIFEFEQRLAKRRRMPQEFPIVYIGDDFPKEVKGSEDTRRLKGTNAKAKANATTETIGLLQYASNKRWQENFKSKHGTDAVNNMSPITCRNAGCGAF